MLDLRPFREANAHGEWLGGPHPFRDIGGTFLPTAANPPLRLPLGYDFVVFVDRAEASRPLRHK